MSGRRARALAFAVVLAGVRGVGAAPAGLRSVVHVGYAAPEAAVRPGPRADEGAAAPAARQASGGGALTITPTFDASITGNPSAAAIEAAITDAIGVFEGLFDDPITVSILFRYATTYPDGSTPLPAGALAVSGSVVYVIPWSTYVGALAADATTANDAAANASLPGSALSTNVLLSSANGRAVGLATPPGMLPDGSVGPGGTYDGIVTVNAGKPFTFVRPPTPGMYDAERSIEHEIDEVLGLGSYLDVGGTDLRPEDLFSWSAPGTRNLTTSGSRYLSIDGGTTDVVGLNQTSGGDFGDWLSGACPQAMPDVQNAFSCADQASDVTATSPEGIDLDVIGYDSFTIATTTTSVATTSTTTTSATTTTTAPGSTTTVPTTTTSTTNAGATTSTSTAPATTSTSLAPPGCVTAADCDDGNPCTEDACTAGTCSNTEETGVPDVVCHIQTETADPLCPDGTATVIASAIHGDAARAITALQAFGSASPKKMAKLRRKAGNALAQIAKAASRAAKKHKVSAPCAATIEATAGRLRARVSAL